MQFNKKEKFIFQSESPQIQQYLFTSLIDTPVLRLVFVQQILYDSVHVSKTSFWQYSI